MNRHSNGYRKLQGNGLKEFRLQFGSDINVGIKTTVRCGADQEIDFPIKTVRRNNGYKVLEGEELKEFKTLYLTEIDFGQKTKALGIFNSCLFGEQVEVLAPESLRLVMNTEIFEIIRD